MTLTRRVIKKCLRATWPRLAVEIEAARCRANSHRAIASWGTQEVNQALVNRFGLKVQEGPFAGLILDPIVMSEQIGPFLLGVYESEIDEAWHRILSGEYRRIFDVGAKFGYYAVGLARRFPKAEVVAWDTDWWARKATRSVATANRVTNVEVRSYCSQERILAEDLENGLVISDCEGYEDVLFSQRTAPSLLHTTLLIEVHEEFVSGVKNRMRELFAASHRLSAWSSESPRRRTTLNLDFLDDRGRELAEIEIRGRQDWFLFEPVSRRFLT